MPYEDPDPTDPMTLHGMAFETESVDATREMAACFIDEYQRLGFDRARLLQLFKTPGYVGPHLAYQTLGHEQIVSLIEEHALRWGPREGATPVDRNSAGDVTLHVLD